MKTRYHRITLFAAVLWLAAQMTLPVARAFQQTGGLEVGVEDAARRGDHVEVRIVGRVTVVRGDGRAFRVEAEELGFDVEPGFATRFPRLREGDRVLVLGALRTPTTVTAREVRVIGARDPSALTGIVRDRDLPRRRFTIRVDSGDVTFVEYTRDTLFARLGRRVAPEQVQIGDAVWIAGERMDNRLVRATRVEVTASGDRWRSGQTGAIEGVGRRDRTLRVAFERETRTVRVPIGTNIRHGIRVLLFDELREGDYVRISGELGDEGVLARNVEVLDRGGETRHVEGRVKEIDRRSRVLTLTVNALIPITARVQIPEGTQISRGTRRLTFEEIRIGDRIQARGPTRQGTIAAEFVELLP